MDHEQIRISFAQNYISKLTKVLSAMPFTALSEAIVSLEYAYLEGKNVFIAGNGGSSATANHMANDLMIGTAKSDGKGMKAISLSSNESIVTAIANDNDYSDIFSIQLDKLGNEGDLLIAISASGNSNNIVSAINLASSKKMKTIGLLGMGGGKASSMVDVSVIIPSDEYGFVEDAHMVIDHLITKYIIEWKERNGDEKEK